MTEALRNTDRLDPERDIEQRSMVQPGDAITPGTKGTPVTVAPRYPGASATSSGRDPASASSPRYRRRFASRTAPAGSPSS